MSKNQYEFENKNGHITDWFKKSPKHKVSRDKTTLTTKSMALVIWGPVISALVIYSIAYLTMALIAQSQLNTYNKSLSECSTRQASTPISDDNTGIAPCQILPARITHGFLGLPYYSDI